MKENVILKRTSNTNFKQFENTPGFLYDNGFNGFEFVFETSNGRKKINSTRIIGKLGELNHPASREIVFHTKNSTYVFEKMAPREGVFVHLTK